MKSLADIDIKYLKGVGDARAKLLGSELEISSFRDLAYYFPFRHVDRSRYYKVAEFTGEMPEVQVRGHFVNFTLEGEGARKRLVGAFTDGRSLMEVVWFARINSIREGLRPRVEYVLFGKPNYYKGAWSMVHPEIEVFNPDRPIAGLMGIYPMTDTLRKRNFSTKSMRHLVHNLLQHPRFTGAGETLPREVVERLHLMPLHEAIANMHFPTSVDALQRARERMKFEELFYVEMHILRFSKERGLRIRGFSFPRIGANFNGFYSRYLPFELTGAQKRVIREIRGDMCTGRQMNRLLQGDVGSGKTMVAFMSMLIAVDNGCQGALMAPTEILAAQHYETLRTWCEGLGLQCRLLTGSIRGRERKEILEQLESGEIDILVGTHALIEDSVKFRKLGLAVIDEQHRFGVAQRAKMWGKSETVPHVLVMTATPIPRTLAMTVYGDLDVSVIDELPPGRKPIQTTLLFDDNRMELNRMVHANLRSGNQVYFVYPLIKENDKLELKSLEEGYRQVCDTFRDYRVCFVHGQMKPEEKDRQMELFVSGEAQIMVATTVIEVGVNVPRASMMVIENAERFGLSQLHQLRGRVGRGADQSFCILVSKHNMAATSRKRLNIMTETTDGFVISEADMKLRGPGDMEGTQQSGLAFTLRVADLARDGQIIQLARDVAGKVLDGNPELIKVEQTTPEASGSADAIKLSPESLETVSRELAFRFARTFDWSQIS